MLADIIGKELKDCVYGYRSLLVFVLSSALFVIAIYTGSREYQVALQEYRRAQAMLRQQAAEQSNLYALGNFGFDLVKPPPTLGILVSGVEPHAPRVYNVSVFSFPEPRASAASENPTSSVFGTLDLSFIVQVVLGLTALLFTFSTICGEKESGTLKLQLANALPKDVLLSGKLIGSLLGLLVPVAVAFLLACLVLLDFDGVAPTGEDWLRVLLLGIDFLLYLTVLFALGVFLSALTTRSTNAFALCLVVWVLLVALAPKLAALAAKRIAPVESYQEFEMKRVAVHRQGSVEAQQEYSQYVREHNREMPPLTFYFDLTGRVRAKQDRALNQLEDDYRQHKQRQERWAQNLARVSPAGSTYYAAMNLARTGLQRDIRFQSALLDYRSEFNRYYDRKSRELVALTHDAQAGSTMVRQDLSDLPMFDFREEPLSASLNRALPDMGFLVIWSFAFFAGAYFAFLRYDVR